MKTSKGCGQFTSSIFEGCFFCKLLSHLFPQILVASDVWSTYLKNSSEAGVNESLDSFHSGDGVSPRFGSLEQYRLLDGVDDPDFRAGAEER